jgi:hypothetical protein
MHCKTCRNAFELKTWQHLAAHRLRASMTFTSVSIVMCRFRWSCSVRNCAKQTKTLNHDGRYRLRESKIWSSEHEAQISSSYPWGSVKTVQSTSTPTWNCLRNQRTGLSKWMFGGIGHPSAPIREVWIVLLRRLQDSSSPTGKINNCKGGRSSVLTSVWVILA